MIFGTKMIEYMRSLESICRIFWKGIRSFRLLGRTIILLSEVLEVDIDIRQIWSELIHGRMILSLWCHIHYLSVFSHRLHILKSQLLGVEVLLESFVCHHEAWYVLCPIHVYWRLISKITWYKIRLTSNMRHLNFLLIPLVSIIRRLEGRSISIIAFAFVRS